VNAETPAAHLGRPHPTARRRSTWGGWRSWFVAPVALAISAYFALFFLAPFVISFGFALHNWDLLSTPVFLGRGNFETMARDELFLNGLRVSFMFVAIELPIILALQLVVGALLSRLRQRVQRTLLAMIFVPVITPWLVVIMMWSFIFYPRVGLLAGIGQWFGVTVHNPLASPDTALYAIIAITIWKFIGFGAVVFLVGINELPQSLYEAAMIDGAGALVQFRHVTWPLLRPVTLGMTILSFIGAMQVFEPFLLMTGGGPQNATRSLVLYIYEQSFLHLRFGYASAMTLVLFGILLLMSIVQMALGRTRWEY
jgi:multiple sugar transport system permease protein/sn-glycerol 3-phosphate transport system permease protein